MISMKAGRITIIVASFAIATLPNATIEMCIITNKVMRVTIMIMEVVMTPP